MANEPDPSYLHRRQLAFPDHLRAEVNGKFDTLARVFGVSWLEESGDNPVQLLWARRDALATNELTWLGDAIQRMRSVNPAWTAQETKKVKEAPANNRSGALFEILGLSTFEHDNQRVKPAGKGNPGYDGIVSTSEGFQSYLSLKNYGVSVHNAEVQKRGAKLEAALIEFLKNSRLTAMSLRILARVYPVSNSVWKALEDGLVDAISRARAGGSPALIGDHWSISAFPIPPSYGPFHEHEISYQFLLLVPHHANESNNLLTKLGEACSNFKKHAASIPATAARRVFVRLPAAASTEECSQWARSYFDDTKDPTLTGLFMYQTVVAASALRHYVCNIENPYTNVRNVPVLRGSFFVGVVDPMPATMVAKDGEQQVPLDQFYSYQRGNIYTVSQQTGNAENLAPGVLKHIVLRMNGGDVVIKGNFPPTEDLLLFP